MNNQEYEQQRRECWEEFKNEVFNGNISYNPYGGIDYAFNRAYTLGKQTETVTQEDVEKAAEKHADEMRVISGIPGALVPMLHDIAKSSYLQGAQDFLGKREKDADTVIRGWVARDKDDNLFIYSDKPKRVYDGEFSRWEGLYLDTISNSLFPDLTWDDEPQECEIIIKRKK